MLDVPGQAAGRGVASATVLLERLHHDPVEFAAYHARRLAAPLFGNSAAGSAGLAEPGARRGWIFLANQPQNLQQCRLLQPLPRQRRAAGHQFIEQHAQAVDVRARIDIDRIELCLLRAHVLQRADDAAEAREQRTLGKRLAHRLSHAEIDDFWHRLAVITGDEDIRGLDIPMNDAFLMSVLNGLTYRHHEFEPLPRRQSVFLTVLRDGDALHQLHDEVRNRCTAAVFRRSRPADGTYSGIQHFGYVGMVHQSECLPFRFEAGDNLGGVHARFDQLERNRAFHRRGLFRHPHRAHAAFADLLQQLVRADACSCEFKIGRRRGFGAIDRDGGRLLEQTASIAVGVQQFLDRTAE